MQILDAVASDVKSLIYELPRTKSGLSNCGNVRKAKVKIVKSSQWPRLLTPLHKLTFLVVFATCERESETVSRFTAQMFYKMLLYSLYGWLFLSFFEYQFVSVPLHSFAIRLC